MNGKGWTKQQDAVMKRMRRDEEPFDKIAKRLGRTSTACRARAKVLGIVKPRAKKRRSVTLVTGPVKQNGRAPGFEKLVAVIPLAELLEEANAAELLDKASFETR